MGGFIFKRKKQQADNAQTAGGLFGLNSGESAVISKIEISGNAAARLNSLDVSVGKKITVLSYSRFKSSVLIGCGAVRLGIRKALAVLIEVEKCA